MADERFDVVVVGGGQSGLAAGYHLKRWGGRFVILDGGSRVGDTWRRRWDSLRLFTPARINGLPGAPFPASPGAIVSKDQVADYLESYAKRFELPVSLGVKVTSLSRDGQGFVLDGDGRRIRADQVIVASGSYPTPRRPEFARELDASTVQLHSTEYRNGSQLRGDVMVVGAGNSGAEIALDASSGHRTYLSGRKTGQVPYPAIFAPPMYWLVMRVTSTDNPIGRRIASQVMGRGQALVRIKPGDLAAAGIERVPRVAGVSEGRPRLEDGRVMDVGTVVWCTGFEHSYPWIKLRITDEVGRLRHKRGVVTSQPGLYFVGVPFQHTMSSSLIGGVGEDARYIVEKIAAP
jgi:putative flavoprotein involved in K+ transport